MQQESCDGLSSPLKDPTAVGGILHFVKNKCVSAGILHSALDHNSSVQMRECPCFRVQKTNFSFLWKEGVWAAFRFYLTRFYVVLDFMKFLLWEFVGWAEEMRKKGGTSCC